MPPDTFSCQQCGHCCRHLPDAYSTCVTTADIQRWRDNYRHDILAWVELTKPQGGYGGHLWVDPESGEEVSHCPWLRQLPGQEKYICAIDEMKPSHCRDFPPSREYAEATGCLGWQKNVLPEPVPDPEVHPELIAA